MSSTPPGWYPDAQGAMRWFDGSNWTEHVQNAGSAAGSGPGTPSSPPPSQPPSQPSQPGQQPGQPSWTPSGAPGAPAGGYGGYGGYGAPGDPTGPVGPGGPGGPGKPGRNKGLVYGLSGLGALLVAAIVVLAIVLINNGGDDNSDQATDPASPSTSSSPSSPAPSSTDGDQGGSSGVVPTTPDDSGAAPAGATEAEEVAGKFVQAIVDGDCQGVKQYVIGGSPFASQACADSGVPSGASDYIKVKTHPAAVDGDMAEVTVDLLPNISGSSSQDPAGTLDLTLTDVDGEWKVSDATSG